jgi:hypothetical protein
MAQQNLSDSRWVWDGWELCLSEREDWDYCAAHPACRVFTERPALSDYSGEVVVRHKATGRVHARIDFHVGLPIAATGCFRGAIDIALALARGERHGELGPVERQLLWIVTEE